MSWWVTVPGGHPLGPVRTERLLRAIAAGKVPSHALACRVGDEEWRPLTSIQRFADALVVRSLDRYGAPRGSDGAPYVEPETVEPRSHRSSVPPPHARGEDHHARSSAPEHERREAGEKQ
jgi:hypothetical protein